MSDPDPLERAQADGKISPEDADEVRRFGDFLDALSEAGIRPSTMENRTPETAAAFRKIYQTHYPEYAIDE